MGDDELTRRTVLYGSAGMAAAGMIPGAKASPKPKPEEEEVEPEEPPAEAVADPRDRGGRRAEPDPSGLLRLQRI